MTNSFQNLPGRSLSIRRTEKRLLILLIGTMLLLAMSTLSAQTGGKISGAVADEETGEPLIGCNIIIVGTTMGGVTDVEGSFFILNVLPGKYDVQASLVGYQKVVQREVIVNSGKTTTASFKLRATTLVQGVVEIAVSYTHLRAHETRHDL